MKAATHSAERVVMRDVPWATYLSLVEIEDRHTRIAYDDGVMEIMSPRRLHERVGCLLGRLVEIWTEVNDIEISSTKSTTFKSDTLSKGFEADESYYISNSPLVRSVEEVDLAIHPGPDLVIEIDVTNSSMSKFNIYAALRVAEVWRWEDESVKIYSQTDVATERDGYRQVEGSIELPNFPIADAIDIISNRLDENETRLIREFRKRVEAMVQ